MYLGKIFVKKSSNLVILEMHLAYFVFQLLFRFSETFVAKHILITHFLSIFMEIIVSLSKIKKNCIILTKNYQISQIKYFLT